jgi:predicted alpha/beta hydrolase
VQLRGHLWHSCAAPERGVVIINPATGVLARYYHCYARFLAAAGFRAVTYDYRGIGASRPVSLRGCGYRWRDWGEQDFDAVLAAVMAEGWPGPLQVVGHSIGGFLPGFSERAAGLDRLLTVGAQYGYWRDYCAVQRIRLVCKWHVAMPALTLALGYFPGRWLGWLEDLPAGVANEWSFRGRRMEDSYPQAQRGDILARFGSVTAPILAVGLSDDPIASPRALRRSLDYYPSARKTQLMLTPHDFGMQAIGHFGLFHERHRDGFWQASLAWLTSGENPWPFAEIPPLARVRTCERFGGAAR